MIKAKKKKMKAKIETAQVGVFSSEPPPLLLISPIFGFPSDKALFAFLGYVFLYRMTKTYI